MAILDAMLPDSRPSVLWNVSVTGDLLKVVELRGYGFWLVIKMLQIQSRLMASPW